MTTEQYSIGYDAGYQDGFDAAPVQPVKQEPVAWHDKIKGMEVSVDVSTGEHDATHRVFGRVDSVMLESCGAQEDIILVIEESRNFAAPVAMSQAEQDKQEPVAWDLAEKVRRDLDRQSCPDAYMRIAIESIVKHFPAPPPVQEITEDVDAAMVEMKNIYPPLRRSECERLIRAAKYAAPVERQWVDLTDDEIYPLYNEPISDREAIEFARAVITAFKEKNK